MSSRLAALSFEPMAQENLSQVMYNERRSYSHPWTEGIFKDCIASGHECWLILLADVPIGHCVLSMGAGESHLLNICINPEHQGQGYGAELLAHIVERARLNACECVFLEVRSSNLAAYKLYEKMGFTEIGVRKDYYPAYVGFEDALVLQKLLSMEQSANPSQGNAGRHPEH